VADLFACIPPLAEIEITVYGMRRESYEAVTRTTGSFARFWRGLNLLSERNVPFLVKSVVLPPNRSEMDEFERGPATLPALSWKVTRPTYAVDLELRTRRDDAEKNRLIESLRLPPQENIAVVMRDAARFRSWTRALADRLLQPPGDYLFRCGVAKGASPCVDAYGFAHPCMSLLTPEMSYYLFGTGCGGREAKLGDYATNQPIIHPTNQLQNALAQFTLLSELQTKNPAYLHRCACCFLFGVCNQCPAHSWIEYGSFDTPVEYQCDLTHAWARYLGWLGENEHGWEMTNWLDRF
jgi:MoaA/NifB/PqqE/SkfB family radical SAM enzyme